LTMQPIYNRFYLPTLFFIPVEKRKVWTILRDTKNV
jgi:hypothetical protein